VAALAQATQSLDRSGLRRQLLRVKLIESSLRFLVSRDLRHLGGGGTKASSLRYPLLSLAFTDTTIAEL